MLPLSLLLGGSVWTALSFVQPSLAAWILALGPTVVVPLGLNLIERHSTHELNLIWKSARWLVLPAAFLFVLSFWFGQSALAATLTMPWLLTTLMMAIVATQMLWRNGWTMNRIMAQAAAMLLLPVGAGWAVLSRAGLQPQGFSHEIVLLTGVHFHYAGFALPILAAFAIERRPKVWERLLIALVVLGVPLVGIGISLSPHIEVVAAILLAAACLVVAAMQVRDSLRLCSPNQTTLLLISSCSLAAAMLLAGVYALGEFTQNEWLSIPVMVKTHGILNAFGFVLCGLIARTLEAADGATR